MFDERDYDSRLKAQEEERARHNAEIRKVRKRRMITRISACVAGVVVFVALATLATSCGTVTQGDIGYQVGGGMMDPSKNKVKSDLLKPGRHVLGPMDKVWSFPSSKTLRFQDFSVDITTKDGKKLKVNGQMPFRFVGEDDPALSKKFAEGLGARKYGGKRPGESNEGWENMLNQLVAPEIYATLKDQFGRVYCADFEPACRSIDPRADVPDAQPEVVYNAIAAELQTRVDNKLGDSYLRDIKIRVNKIELPPEVQRNVDQVTAEQAKTKAAEQAERTARAEAEAIRIKGKALKANRGLIALEVAKECKGGEKCTVILDGTGNASASVPAR